MAKNNPWEIAWIRGDNSSRRRPEGDYIERDTGRVAEKAEIRLSVKEAYNSTHGLLNVILHLLCVDALFTFEIIC